MRRLKLENLGNTCFFNCALQCITSIDVLCNEIASPTTRITIRGRESKEADVVRAFQDYLLQLEDSRYRQYAPRLLKEAIGRIFHQFSAFDQQDAFDLMTTLINTLSDGLNKADPSIKLERENTEEYYKMNDQEKLEYCRRRLHQRYDSPIISYFYGFQKNLITCKDCKKSRSRFQPMSFLSVPIRPRETIYFLLLQHERSEGWIDKRGTNCKKGIGKIYRYFIPYECRDYHLKDIEQHIDFQLQFNINLTWVDLSCNAVEEYTIGQTYICHPTQFECRSISKGRYTKYFLVDQRNSNNQINNNNRSFGNFKRLFGLNDKVININGEDLTISVEHCIRAFSAPSELAEGSEWQCENGSCQGKSCTFENFIYELPRVLIVHLRRFTLVEKSHFSHMKKINDRVNYPLTLNMNEFIRHRENENELNGQYSLVAVSRHHGSLSGGHYNAYCRSGNQWFSCDDTSIRSITENQVVNDPAAIFLIYEMNRDERKNDKKPRRRLSVEKNKNGCVLL